MPFVEGYVNMAGTRWSEGSAPLQGEILPPEAAAQDRKVRADFWDKLKGVVRRIPFAESLVAAYFCATDPQTPTRVRVTLLGALAYFILPFDAIPDFLPVVGFTDDAAVLAIAIRMVAAHITPEHWDRARAALDSLGTSRQAT